MGLGICGCKAVRKKFISLQVSPVEMLRWDSIQRWGTEANSWEKHASVIDRHIQLHQKIGARSEKAARRYTMFCWLPGGDDQAHQICWLCFIIITASVDTSLTSVIAVVHHCDDVVTHTGRLEASCCYLQYLSTSIAWVSKAEAICMALKIL